MSDGALTQAETRAVQLAILDHVDAFCRERGFAYYLWAGTLLGAVRHGGYIPWDDDIDIAMPRPGYETFCREFAATASETYQLFERSTHPEYAYPFARVSDVRTRLVEGSRAAVTTGLNIDVFPLDGWPDAPRALRVHRARMRLIHRVVALWTSRPRPGGGIRRLKNLAIRVKRPVLDRVPIRVLTGIISRWAGAYPVDGGSHVGVTVFRYLERVPREAYGEPVDIVFEGRHYRAGPRDHDRILRTLYGNWRRIPDEVEQAGRYRHFGAAYWVRPPAAPSAETAQSSST